MLLAVALGAAAKPASGAPQKPLSVCTVSTDAPRFVGKRVRVEGYIFDLGSHGFVLASKRSCKEQGQLKLQIRWVSETKVWQSAFANSDGPKRAILIGVIRWKSARYQGVIPGLDVERVAWIAARDADESDF